MGGHPQNFETGWMRPPSPPPGGDAHDKYEWCKLQTHRMQKACIKMHSKKFPTLIIYPSLITYNSLGAGTDLIEPEHYN